MDLSASKISPAKINLYLDVKSKRKDGFHNIESLMTFCNFGDLISVKKSNKFNLRVEGPFSSYLKNKDNLIEKTIEKLESLYNQEFKVDVVLKKNLPISSGMGGGSSNAATLIRCIKEIFKLGDYTKGFNDLLLSLGADVPFCYNGKTAIVTGIGENLRFIKNFKEYYVLLINPKIEISTKAIFESLNSKKQSEKRNIYEAKINETDLNFILNKKNDLEGPAIKMQKIIGKILFDLSSYKGSIICRMTGSGATCFALFENIKDLEKAKEQARNSYKKFWIKGSKLINSVQDI